MKKFLLLIEIALFIFVISGCKKMPRLNNSPDDNKIIDLIEDDKNKDLKEKIEIKISCGKGDLKKFIKDGWVINKQLSEKKVCSWKSYPANNKCNMEKDKGCKITKPDKIGEEIIYILERKNQILMKKNNFKIDELIEMIYLKFINNKYKKTNFDKKELEKFIYLLLNEN